MGRRVREGYGEWWWVVEGRRVECIFGEGEGKGGGGEPVMYCQVWDMGAFSS